MPSRDRAKLTLSIKNTIRYEQKAAIEKVFDTLVETLKNGENATLLGFGSFTVVERPERQGVNPKTGEKITLAAKKVIKFKPSSRFEK